MRINLFGNLRISVAGRLHPFGAGGAYLNFMMEEGDDRIRATYRGNYHRLAARRECAA